MSNCRRGYQAPTPLSRLSRQPPATATPAPPARVTAPAAGLTLALVSSHAASTRPPQAPEQRMRRRISPIVRAAGDWGPAEWSSIAIGFCHASRQICAAGNTGSAFLGKVREQPSGRAHLRTPPDRTRSPSKLLIEAVGARRISNEPEPPFSRYWLCFQSYVSETASY